MCVAVTFFAGDSMPKKPLKMTLTLIFRKTQKSLWIKGSKRFGSWTAEEKDFWTYLATLKVAPGTFWDWIQKLKKI